MKAILKWWRWVKEDFAQSNVIIYYQPLDREEYDPTYTKQCL